MVFSKDDRPKFKNPPVVEVAITVQFSEIDKDIFLLNIGRIYDELNGEDFSDISFKNKKGKMSHENNKATFSFVESDDDFDSPRIWLESKDKHFVVQIQPDRLSLNWRKLIEAEKQNYSNFERVWHKFRDILDKISNFSLKYFDMCLDINFLELAYVNVIPFSDFGGIKNIDKCIPSINFKNIPNYLGSMETINFLWNNSLDEQNVIFSIQGLTGTDHNTGDYMLRLDFVQKGGVDLTFDNEAEIVYNWFSDAHLNIVNAFKDTTGSFMHQSNKWGLE